MYANKIPNGQEYKQGGGKWYDGDRETKKIRKYKEFQKSVFAIIVMFSIIIAFIFDIS